MWAACDLLLQLQHVSNDDLVSSSRKKVAVGAYSYHGPGFSSYGATEPLGPKANQLKYPVPASLARRAGESDDEFHDRIRNDIDEFFTNHAHEVGVLLVEPQWGSSLAAQAWPPSLLKHLVTEAQSKGILVCCDEIMCGLGRHGQGTTFLSESIGVEPDAVTFGKAIAAGQGDVLSGVVLRRGARKLGASGRSVLQVHTYAGSSARAFFTAAAVLDEIPSWHTHIKERGDQLRKAMKAIEEESDRTIITHGMGLMQGALFAHPDREVRRESTKVLHRELTLRGVLPYLVPAGGFMVTPVVDVTQSDLEEACDRLTDAVRATLKKINWHGYQL